MDFIKLIRPLNLVIVFITQMSIYHFFIFSFTKQSALNISQALFLSVTTVIITACGYIINDFYDVDIDKINKPDKLIIDKKMSKTTALFYYAILFAVGLLISLYLAWKTDNFALLPLYPCAQLLLFKYAQVYKKTGLIGNLIVALMTAFVSGLILVAERKFLFTQAGERPLAFIIALAVFALLFNFIRELMKDVEDIEGDLAQGSLSFPIQFGIEKTKLIMIFSLLLCLFFLIKIGDLLTMNFGITYIVFLIGYFYYLYSKIKNANLKTDYTTLSKQLKITMVIGLVSMLILSKFSH